MRAPLTDRSTSRTGASSPVAMEVSTDVSAMARRRWARSRDACVALALHAKSIPVRPTAPLLRVSLARSNELIGEALFCDVSYSAPCLVWGELIRSDQSYSAHIGRVATTKAKSPTSRTSDHAAAERGTGRSVHAPDVRRHEDIRART